MGSYKQNYKNIDWSVKIDKTTYVVDNVPVARSDLPTPMIVSDYAPYECPVTGKTIEGRRAHEENLKATGCRILERGEKEDNVKNAARAMEAENIKRDAAIDGIVDQVAADYF